MRHLIGVLCLLSACGPEPRNQMNVPCAGSTMRCDCALSCTSTAPASAGPAERGNVDVTYAEGEGCEPTCH